MRETGELDRLLAEQIAYYRARTPEYFAGVIPGAVGGGELEAALDAFRPVGDALELACGPGTWTLGCGAAPLTGALRFLLRPLNDSVWL